MIDTDKYEERIKSIPIRKLKVGCTLLEDSAFLRDAGLELLAEVKRLRKTLACIAFSPDDPEWVGEKLDELEVDSDTWKRWHE